MNTKKLLLLAAVFALLWGINTEKADAKGHYTITPKSKILMPYTRSPNVNKYTYTWFMVKSYLESLEKKGGGTLTFKKGTYVLANSVYTPSNTKIIFESGVQIVKGNKTGKTPLGIVPTQSIFQVTTPKLSQKNGKAKKYNGAKNVQFIGKGNVTIDLKNIRDSKAFIVAHTQNIRIENITFKHMNTGHFIEMDAAKNVVVTKCRFSSASKDSVWNKEAINIDTPDKNTGGLNLKWSCSDRTPNYNIVIQNCKFSNLKRGIGTHKYSQYNNGNNCYHQKISIKNCTFTNIVNEAIFLMNWKNTKICDNKFINSSSCLGFRGVKSPFLFTGNETQKSPFAYPPFNGHSYTNNGPGSQYGAIQNDMGISSVEDLEKMNAGE